MDALWDRSIPRAPRLKSRRHNTSAFRVSKVCCTGDIYRNRWFLSATNLFAYNCSFTTKMRKERLYSDHNQINGGCGQFGQLSPGSFDSSAPAALRKSFSCVNALSRLRRLNAFTQHTRVGIIPHFAKKFPAFLEDANKKRMKCRGA